MDTDGAVDSELDLCSVDLLDEVDEELGTLRRSLLWSLRKLEVSNGPRGTSLKCFTVSLKF